MAKDPNLRVSSWWSFGRVLSAALVLMLGACTATAAKPEGKEGQPAAQPETKPVAQPEQPQPDAKPNPEPQPDATPKPEPQPELRMPPPPT
ncbi:MAG TPA: hypothetical protein VIK91_10090 [Nannocystis sp.]